MLAWGWGVLLELTVLHGTLIYYLVHIFVFVSSFETYWKAPMMRFISQSPAMALLTKLTHVMYFLFMATAMRGLLGFLLSRCLTGSGDGGAMLLAQRLCASGDPLLCAIRLYLGILDAAGVKVAGHVHLLLAGSPDEMVALERVAATRDMLSWVPPPKALFDSFWAPYAFVLRPDVEGLEGMVQQLNGRPALFVMNHSLGGIEMPITISLLFKETGIFVRALGDHLHFSLPLWGNLIKLMGGVDGTRDNCTALMENGQNLLVYPGGAHEVFKSKNVPKYGLQWKDRRGFARMAIKHGYAIVPCCCVGSEDFLEIAHDVDMGWMRRGLSIPLIKPDIRKMQKLYYWFSEPIETAQYGGDADNDEYANTVRDATRAAVEHGIARMQEKQENDPDRLTMKQATTKIQKCSKELCEWLGEKGGTRKGTRSRSKGKAE